MTVGEPLSDGAHLKIEDGFLFLVSNDMKRWITDENTISDCHFKNEEQEEDWEGLSHLIEGPVITTDPDYPA